MRVATYTQPAAATRGSIAALSILVLTILLGTTVASTVAAQFVPAVVGAVTYVWMGLYVLAFLGLMLAHGINWLSWLVRYRILLVLLLLGSVLSVAWSIDSRVSAERVVHLLGTSLLGIYLGFTVPLLTLLRVFAVVLGGILFASTGAALALPELGITAYEGQLVWSGVTSSKNHLGFWAATGVLLYVALSDSTRSVPLRLLCYLMAGVSLALLAFSHSATSLLAMLVGGSLSLYLFIANRFRLGFVRMAVLAVLFAALVGAAVVNIDTAELVGRTDDLTGRGEVWAQTWKLILNRPMSGYGYGSLWFPTDATLWIQQSLTDFTWVVHHAHNGFLQIASEVGLPLALVALLMVAQQVIEIVYCQYQRQQAGTLFVLAFVITFLIGNFSEARFLVTRELYWVLFIALPISMLRQINLVSSEDEADEGADDAASAGRGPFDPDAGPRGGSGDTGGRAPALPIGPSPSWAGAVAGGAGATLVAAARSGDNGATGFDADGAEPLVEAAPFPGREPDPWWPDDDIEDGVSDRTSRWDDDDGWGDDSVASETGVFESAAADIDLGPDGPDLAVPVVEDPSIGDFEPEPELEPGSEPDAIAELDRTGRILDATGDGTGAEDDDWLDVPVGGRR